MGGGAGHLHPARDGRADRHDGEAQGRGQGDGRGTQKRRIPMNDFLNQLAFGWYPYLAVTVLIVGSILRFDADQYSWRSQSSQFLRRKQMIWGSNLFHIGVLVLFFGHFVGPADADQRLRLCRHRPRLQAAGRRWSWAASPGSRRSSGRRCSCTAACSSRACGRPRRSATSRCWCCSGCSSCSGSARPTGPCSTSTARDGALHGLGERHRHLRPVGAEPALRGGDRSTSCTSSWADAVPDHAVHPPRAHLERAGLVSVPARLPDRPLAGVAEAQADGDIYAAAPQYADTTVSRQKAEAGQAGT